MTYLTSLPVGKEMNDDTSISCPDMIERGTQFQCNITSTEIALTKVSIQYDDDEIKHHILYDGYLGGT